MNKPNKMEDIKYEQYAVIGNCSWPEIFDSIHNAFDYRRVHLKNAPGFEIIAKINNKIYNLNDGKYYVVGDSSKTVKIFDNRTDAEKYKLLLSEKYYRENRHDIYVNLGFIKNSDILWE